MNIYGNFMVIVEPCIVEKRRDLEPILEVPHVEHFVDQNKNHD